VPLSSGALSASSSAREVFFPAELSVINSRNDFACACSSLSSGDWVSESVASAESRPCAAGAATKRSGEYVEGAIGLSKFRRHSAGCRNCGSGPLVIRIAIFDACAIASQGASALIDEPDQPALSRLHCLVPKSRLRGI